MTIKSATCHEVACDVCGQSWEDPDSGTIPHFEDRAKSVRWAHRYFDGWIVGADGYAICETDDDAHQAARDAMLPAAPVPVIDGQVELDFAALKEGGM